MPRDGSGIYTKPYPNVVSGTTIESAVHNGTVSDIETDLNAVRPIIAGGTGASNADDALKNISAEKAAQLVTSYDSHLWFPGSFRSAAAASGAPNATSSFVGTAYINETLANPPTNANVVLEARDQNDTIVPGRTYVREKKAGTWGAWTGGIFAAPFDALAYNGIQINGSMEVSQEIGTPGSATSGAYIADNWRVYRAGTMVTMSQQLNLSIAPGFRSTLGIGVTTAKASLAATDVVQLYQTIEGYRVARLAWGTANAQPITIGFWIKHARTGTYSVVVSNGTGRGYATTYTQNVADTAEYKTVTIPGDTSGTWLTDIGLGMHVIFAMAAGSSVIAASANTWLPSTFSAAPGQVNGVASTSDVFRITGVIILPGTQALTAAQSPNIMRPYDQELEMCHRYYQKSYNYDTLPGSITTTGALTSIAAVAGQQYVLLSTQFSPELRSTPTMTFLNPVTGSSASLQIRFQNAATNHTASVVASAPSYKFVGLYTSSAVPAAGETVLTHFVADARL